jgi:ferritin-like metal-binding protein YciE
LALSVKLAHRDILAVIQMIEDERDETEERFEKIERTLQRQGQFRTRALQDAYRLITDQGSQISGLRRMVTTLLGTVERLENELEERR